jgi:hypothetical protein
VIKHCTYSIAVTNQCTYSISVINQCTYSIAVTNQCTYSIAVTNQCTYSIAVTNQCTYSIAVTNQRTLYANECPMSIWYSSLSRQQERVQPSCMAFEKALARHIPCLAAKVVAVVSGGSCSGSSIDPHIPAVAQVRPLPPIFTCSPLVPICSAYV